MHNIYRTLFLCLIFVSCNKTDKENMNSNIQPPIATKKDTTLEKHGDKRVDSYYWLRNREDKEVIDYLNAENEYYQKMTAHTKGLQEDLFQELKARIKEDDESVPYFYNGYFYITRFETGKDYPIYSRKKGSLAAKEEILFDTNIMAKGHKYFKLVGLNISDDNKLAAFAIDTIGRRIYTLKIKNLETGKVYKDAIEQTTGNSTWANDNKTLFYTTQNKVTLRSEAVKKHILNSSNADETVFFEKDEMFNVRVLKSKSTKYLIIGSYSTLTTEYQTVDASKPNDKFKVFHPRTRGLEYHISHFNDAFYIVTNKDKATNFKVMKTSLTKTDASNWKDVIAHRKEVLVEGIEILNDYLIVEEKQNGLNKIRIKSWDDKEDYYLPFSSETYTAYLTTNLDMNASHIRYGYESLKTPPSIIEYDLKKKTKKVLKELEVLGGKFDKDNYEEKRVWATAQDGTKIPISMVYRKGMVKNGKNPLLQYGYGSYGLSMDADFNSSILSLLDRGFIYAIAHIRGGEDLGREWYENGKLLKKKNTFTDFIDCSKYLIKEKYTSPKHLYAEGGSAGGLLMGVVVNEAPELYNGIIAGVPFVDVVTTMLDETIPLTTGEYDEWGNPNNKEYYDYMKSYSPYDNIKKQEYPNMYVVAGLHDSQVQYWEPAKWVAKLRTMKKDKNLLFLDTNMDAGHSGASGRFEALRETAKEYSFLLDLEGIKK